MFDSLVLRAWDLYDRAERSELAFVVRPSMPILFFGDSEGYFRSAVRIITVGLNPSLAEFPVTDPFLRFASIEPKARGHQTITVLNDYFRTNPYRSWFGSYEPLLNGAGASYYPGASSTALHTDICSPLATAPTWSALPPECRDRLTDDGHELWHDLLRVLAPDAVVVSVARHYREQIAFTGTDAWHPLHTIARTNPYVVERRSATVQPTKLTQFFFGRAAQLPFGTVGADDRRQIGEAIRRSLDER